MKEKRWATIAAAIQGAIRRGELARGARLAPETQLAEQWNVSQVTVHRALSELQREGWVVRRPRSGTVVADRPAAPATRIGLVFPTLAERPQSDYIRGIEEGLGSAYQPLIVSSKYSPDEEARGLELTASQCAAIICCPLCDPANNPLLTNICATKPLLFVDRIPQGVDADAFMTDNFGSMLTGLNHLFSLGHSRIAYFTESKMGLSSVRDRQAAYVEFMRQKIQAAAPMSWVRQFPGAEMDAAEYLSSVETALAELLIAQPAITAIACQNDAVLDAVLQACVYLRICVPEDLAVLSFSDTARRIPRFGVFCLVQRAFEMGRMAASRIQQRLINPSDAVPQATLVPADMFPARVHQMSPIAKRYAERNAEKSLG